MAPFAHTVGFINCYSRKLLLRMDDSEDPPEMVRCAVFWSNIEEPG
jgi:hypothetical protein